MKATVALLASALLFHWTSAANTEEPPAKSEAPATSAEAKPAAETTPAFKPPPGFRTRKRGELVLYCRREAVLGSRFPAEKCYDEAGVRDIERAKAEEKDMLEHIRACGRACDISL
jgi:hypothetical protein